MTNFEQVKRQVIRERLKLVGISQAQVARNAGIRPDYFVHMLSGKRRITTERFEKIAIALGVTCYALTREIMAAYK